MPPRRSKAPDLEEITPNHFIIHNEHAFSVLRGEGERRGKLFELTGTRREGLLGRLSLRNYNVLTLDNRISVLPDMPWPELPGDEGWRPQAGEIERLSVFDLNTRDWRTVDVELRAGEAGMWLRANQIVRRRRGRSAPSYAVAAIDRPGVISLRPLDETSALLAGHAQAAPITLPVLQQGEAMLLPALTLPQPYRDFLRRVAEETSNGWQIKPAGIAYAARALERLGMFVDDMDAL